MTTSVEAVYENGVLRPLTPLPLPDGRRVHVVVASEEIAAGQDVAAILAEIAALPVETLPEPLTSRDHDRVLYLAAKANEGPLSAAEQAEYEDYVEVVDLVAILQLRARTVLAQQPNA